MEFWQGFLTLTLVHLLAAASPGPDFALVSRQSLLHGRKAGLLTSVGIAAGLSVHIAYSALGMAAIIAHSAGWMTAIKIVGGLYLIYLGSKGIRAKPAQTALAGETAGEARSGRKLVMSGFLCNTFNPKAPVYFLSLFTIILSPNLPLETLCIYGLWIMLLQLAWFSFVVFFLTQPAVRVRFLALGHWLDRLFGVTMVALGLRVLSSSTK
ncbi:MAG: LysE family transporter [Formivibrio sp.]|nr:LysE family transporter [Formivibrio sp.]